MAHAKKARAIGFNHVALEVGDIDEALAFYGRLFDFELRSRSKISAATPAPRWRCCVLAWPVMKRVSPRRSHLRRNLLEPRPVGIGSKAMNARLVARLASLMAGMRAT